MPIKSPAQYRPLHTSPRRDAGGRFAPLSSSSSVSTSTSNASSSLKSKRKSTSALSRESDDEGESPQLGVKRAVVLSDMQVPYHSKEALRAVLAYVREHEWDKLIIIGDFMDLPMISHHVEGNIAEIAKSTIAEHYEVGRAVLDDICDAARARNEVAEVILLEGNHEYRATAYADRDPRVKGLVEVPRGLELGKKSVQWVRSWSLGETYQLGKLHVIHGTFTGRYHAREHVDRYGVNILLGHVHTTQLFTKSMLGTGQSIMAQSIGCLCNFELQYTNGVPYGWQHAFATVNYFDDSRDVPTHLRGNFSHRVSILSDCAFIAEDGRVYDGRRLAPLSSETIVDSQEW